LLRTDARTLKRAKFVSKPNAKTAGPIGLERNRGNLDYITSSLSSLITFVRLL
jgi:hypothetical protein